MRVYRLETGSPERYGLRSTVFDEPDTLVSRLRFLLDRVPLGEPITITRERMTAAEFEALPINRDRGYVVCLCEESGS